MIACLPPFLSKHLLSVTPVIGCIPAALHFTPNPAEVAAVFTAPLRRFLEAGPGYSSRDVEWAPGIPYRLHYFDYSHRGSNYVIWGLTAGMLVVLAERAFGRRPAFSPDPPNAPPYTTLTHDGQRLVLRPTDRQQQEQQLGGGTADALQLAAEAAAEERPRSSAAAAGAAVLDDEAAAALGDSLAQ